MAGRRTRNGLEVKRDNRPDYSRNVHRGRGCCEIRRRALGRAGEMEHSGGRSLGAPKPRAAEVEDRSRRQTWLPQHQGQSVWMING